MARSRWEIVCDGCDTPNDGDVINMLGMSAEKHGRIKPENLKQLQYFWLCRECKEDYPNGARDFFVADFFDEQPYCEECEVDEVEEWGHKCDYCLGEDEEYPEWKEVRVLA